MERDRTVRRLTHIQKTASTTRILNLAKISRQRAITVAGVKSRLFRNKMMENSVIIKHRVRPHEAEIFDEPRSNATKILIPFDANDFRFGAHCLFVGQKNFDSVSQNMFGDDFKLGKSDRKIIDLIDELPSLDPFLLREHLRRNGIEPSRDYFCISDADVGKMHAYVSQQLTGLVRMTGGGDGATTVVNSADRLAEKLLSPTPDKDFEPLKRLLRLSDKEYLDGIFCWRGLLYYKWVLHDTYPRLGSVLKEITAISPVGRRDAASEAYITEAKVRIEGAIRASIARIRKVIRRYDDAYGELVNEAQSGAFRQFLITAPDIFMDIGEEIGAIQHVVSYWTYWSRNSNLAKVKTSELMDIFIDFEEGLSSNLHGSNNAWI